MVDFGFATHDVREDLVSAMPCMDSVFSVRSDTSFGDLSLFCTFPPVEEHTQILEGEECEEIVEPYQFEPQASKSLVRSLAAST